MSAKTPEQRASDRFNKEASYVDFHNHHGYATCIREQVEPLEAEVAKLRALVQVLGNAIYDSVPNHHEDAHARYGDAIDALKEADFVPTNTTEG